MVLKPLRERTDDIPLLAQHFVRLFNERLPQITATGRGNREEAALDVMKRSP